MPVRPMPAGFLKPMLPTLVEAPPEGVDWLHEIKYDGYRTQVVRNGPTARAFTRNGHDWSAKYAPVVEAARGLACQSAILDGELCVQNAAGLTDFKALKAAIRTDPSRLVFFCFDLLMLDGHDLRAEPLVERRARLRDVVHPEPAARLQLSPEHAGDGPALYSAADAHGLEGIVSKRADSRYVGGRTTAWLKVKSFTVGDYSVLGVGRSKSGVPVALLATMGSQATYVGNAAVHLGDREGKRFWSSVERLGTPRARLAGLAQNTKAAWLKEGLVARVRHLRGEDKLRHAVLQSVGLRASGPSEVDDRHPGDE